MFSARAHSGQAPIWRIDLHALGLGSTDEATVTFCGQFVVINPGGGLRLAFAAATHQRMPDGRVLEIPVASCEDFVQRQAGVPRSSRNIVARWKEMAIEEVCDVESCSEPPGGPAARSVTYYLEKPGKPRLSLFHVNCLSRVPRFIGDQYILIFLCDLKGIVVNTEGERIYKMPVLSFPYVTVNRAGTRFTVYERDESFLHELEGTTDRARVKVFESSTGKKLLELRWKVNGESTRDGRVALSDDGSLLALIRSEEVQVFAIPSS